MESTEVIEICEGNATILELMRTGLEDVGFSVVVRDAPPDAGECASLLVVDFDSGGAGLEAWMDAYDEADAPILCLGVRRSRERFEDRYWLERPFSVPSLVRKCRSALKLEDSEVSSIQFARDDDPITRELRYDEAMELEKELGLNEGALGPNAQGDQAEFEQLEEDSDVMAIEDHGSVILEVNDLESLRTGGQLAGSISSRVIDRAELEEAAAAVAAAPRVRTPTFNQTMPETPLALADESNTFSAPGTEPSILAPPSEADQDVDVAEVIKSASLMLAQTWNGIGLTARTQDRADRIQRVLSAAFSQGIRAASGEIRRIPSGLGFAGDIESMTVIEILRTIRDRRLRGRLEIAVKDDAEFVIFLDGGFLEDLENLSGSGELQLLDILHELDFIDTDAHRELSEGYATGEIHKPVEMKLTSEGMVSGEQVRIARSLQVKQAFRRMCSARRGNFAFLEVRQGDGQPWPVQGLHESVDHLLLELLRESSIDTGDSRATSRTRLVLDANRAALIDPDSLTPAELSVLRFFRTAQNLGEALDRLDAEDVDRVVDRLKKLELLKRSDPEIQIPKRLSPDTANTVVSGLSDSLSRVERRQNSTPDEHDQTTHLKESYDVAPEVTGMDSQEVEALVDEALGDLSEESESDVDDSDT